MNANDQRDDLVLAAVPHAAFDGWSKAALTVAARDLGLDTGAAARLFPGGPVEAIAHFVRTADRRMARDMAALHPETLRMGERVFQAVRLRLEPWSGSREAVRRALAVLALPRNLALAARLTWGTSDALWTACGDSSTDFSRYTRRSTLAAVYAATVLYWLDDPSEGCAGTWDFLRRRLGDVQRLPKLHLKLGNRPVRPGAARPHRALRAGGD